MRLWYCVPLSLIALLAGAQSPTPTNAARKAPSYEEFRKMRVLLDRANALRPRRRDTPLRELNITDNEVREIEAIARRELVSSMLNISPVVAGCPCEDGPLCTDQVYVVATAANATLGLQLSRVRNAWVVGPVQQWWRRNDALARRSAKMEFREAFDAQNALLLEFPMCVGNTPDPDTKIAQTK